jgi:hypothetical protein
MTKALTDVPKFGLGKAKRADSIFAELIGEKLSEPIVSDIHPIVHINAGIGTQ